jgi:hypothetical protein
MMTTCFNPALRFTWIGDCAILRAVSELKRSSAHKPATADTMVIPA